MESFEEEQTVWIRLLGLFSFKCVLHSILSLFQLGLILKSNKYFAACGVKHVTLSRRGIFKPSYCPGVYTTLYFIVSNQITLVRETKMSAPLSWRIPRLPACQACAQRKTKVN